MGLTLVVLIFFAILVIWVVMPFLPGLREIRERKDVNPLRVVQDAEVDVQHFAHGLRRFIEQRLADPWTRGRVLGGRVEGRLLDNTPYLVLGPDRAGVASLERVSLRPCEAVLLSGGHLELPDGAVFLLELYAHGRIEGGKRCLYRAALAEGDFEIGPGSQVLRWAHAGRSLAVGPGCELYGRLSAGERIRLESDCRFDRLHAPRIDFGDRTEVGPIEVAATRVLEADVAGLTDTSAGRWRLKGDLTLLEGATIEADLVVRGRARVGVGARIKGSIKSHRDVVLERGVEVMGSVVCTGDVQVGPGCRIHGPVISERCVTLEPGSSVGSAQSPTTVSAATIVAVKGATVFGTVWAHAGGIVRPADLSLDERGATGEAA